MIKIEDEGKDKSRARRMETWSNKEEGKVAANTGETEGRHRSQEATSREEQRMEKNDRSSKIGGMKAGWGK